MSYAKCGAKTKGKRNPRKGQPCRKPAGWGTDHPGEGRCKYHGGATPIKKDGSRSKIMSRKYQIDNETVQVLYEKFLEVEDPHDLSDEIAVARTELQIMLDRESLNVHGIMSVVGKLSEIIEKSRRLEKAQEPTALLQVVHHVIDTIRRYVTDRETLSAIAKELAAGCTEGN